jgi:ADP-ribosylglycohydrolase
MIQFTKGISPVFTNKIRLIEKVLQYENSDKAISELGEGWYGDETLAIALYCLIKSKMDFERSVIMGATTNGDSDSISSVCGGIAGAYCGYSNIPKRFFRGLENRKGILANAAGLYKKRFEN